MNTLVDAIVGEEVTYFNETLKRHKEVIKQFSNLCAINKISCLHGFTDMAKYIVLYNINDRIDFFTFWIG